MDQAGRNVHQIHVTCIVATTTLRCRQAVAVLPTLNRDRSTPGQTKHVSRLALVTEPPLHNATLGVWCCRFQNDLGFTSSGACGLPGKLPRIVPNGNVQKGRLFVFFVFSAIASSLCRRRTMVRPTKQIRGRRETTQVGQLSHNTLAKAKENNGICLTSKKTAVRLPYHAGLCCTRSIEILSALRACESWSIANPGRVKNSIFQSAKQH